MDDRDVRSGKRDSWIELRDCRMVPLGDPAEVDGGENGATETQRLLEPIDVVDRHDATEHRGEMQNRTGCGFELRIGHRPVAGAEEDSLGGQLLDAAAGTDRLVVDANGGMRI